MLTLPEIWKPVVGFEGLYEVSSLGRVKALPRPGVYRLKVGIIPLGMRNGRKTVHFWKDGKQFGFNVHVIVAAAFLGPANGRIVRHKDDDKLRDYASNLVYGTYRDNARDAIKNGKVSRTATAKLTVEQVLLIKKRLNAGERCKTIATGLGISPSTVSNISSKATWWWL
jgi:hypothetical protein